MKEKTVNIIGFLFLWVTLIIFTIEMKTLTEPFGDLGAIISMLSLFPLLFASVYFMSYPHESPMVTTRESKSKAIKPIKNTVGRVKTKAELKRTNPYCSGFLACMFCDRGCEDE